MTNLLTGWQRLWVVLAAASLLMVAFMSWSTRPTTATIAHDFRMYAAISEPERSAILNTVVSPEREAAFVNEARTAKDALLVEAPNGHILVFRGAVDSALATAAAKAYHEQIERSLSRAHVTHFGHALLWWLAGVAMLYIAGVAAGWVYRGFRMRQS
jgi:hypothetical protein